MSLRVIRLMATDCNTAACANVSIYLREGGRQDCLEIFHIILLYFVTPPINDLQLKYWQNQIQWTLNDLRLTM